VFDINLRTKIFVPNKIAVVLNYNLVKFCKIQKKAVE